MTEWVTVKLVMSDNGGQHIGCVVGPFANIEQATEHAARAASGGLGYEKWLVRGLETPAGL